MDPAMVLADRRHTLRLQRYANATAQPLQVMMWNCIACPTLRVPRTPQSIPRMDHRPPLAAGALTGQLARVLPGLTHARGCERAASPRGQVCACAGGRRYRRRGEPPRRNEKRRKYKRSGSGVCKVVPVAHATYGRVGRADMKFLNQVVRMADDAWPSAAPSPSTLSWNLPCAGFSRRSVAASP